MIHATNFVDAGYFLSFIQISYRIPLGYHFLKVAPIKNTK